ncbi:MAG: hypothetical protein SynsKO_14640 [Synoicihabitans sp.]
MSSPLDPTKAIEESAATGEVAEIFADIRNVMDIPLVTSIWRCLAGVPEALPTTWAAIRPLMSSGEIETLLHELQSQVEFPVPAPLSADACAAHAFTLEDGETMQRVVDAYNRSNCLNLIAITALLREPIAGPPVSIREAKHHQWQPFPRLIAPCEMNEAQWELLRASTTIGAAKTNPHIPTLWRHLLDWPELLSIAIDRYNTPSMHDTLVAAVEIVTAWVESNAPRVHHLVDSSVEIPNQAHDMLTRYVGPQPSVARMCTVGSSAAQWLRACEWS